jgi:DNA helicase-2/ATP-dependent DNA helicase PcrA
LHSAKEVSSQIEYFAAPSQLLELVQVAEEITSLISSGVAPEEIAILYRTNAEAAQIQQVLERWNIAYEIDGGSDVLKNEEMCELLELCKLIYSLRTGGDGHELFEVLGYPWLDLESRIVFRIARAAGKCEVSVYELLKKGYEYYLECDPGSPVTAKEFEPFAEFITKLETWAILDTHVTFPEWFETILNESGFLAWIKAQDNKIELLLNVNALFSEIKKLAHGNREVKLKEFLSAISVMREHNIAIQPEDLNVSEGAVQLATVHKAKGREWDYVFIIHCTDGKWGNRRNIELIPLPPSLLKFTDVSKKERNEDERRLFYVALTRAKKRVWCSYPKTIVSENRSQDVVGSMFLMEIDTHLTPKDETSLSYVNQEEKYLERLVAAAQPKYSQSGEKKFFKELVDNLKLSITAINDYLRDPEYFVTYRLLKVPQAKPSFLAYGTAIHSALEKMYAYRQKNGVCLPLEQFLVAYETALQRELITTDEYQRRLSKGKIILSDYYTHVCEEEVQPLHVEKFFGSGFSQTVLDDIPLVGRVDRIDLLDSEKKLVRVVDYKTGRIQSINEIEGKTISAGLSERELSLPEPIRGPYKRQLLFYKLLTELDRTFPHTVTKGTFEFIEPSKTSQKFVRREFDLQQNDVELLKELIREVRSELKQLAFLT